MCVHTLALPMYMNILWLCVYLSLDHVHEHPLVVCMCVHTLALPMYMNILWLCVCVCIP